ncbi:hypothetical protein [Muricoccus radiodurans]|uniref:hypothetical protein n=1 Tax=Muricoccus radiodurans TaxID=2231721 RepID=UPI003CFB91BF
MMKMGWVALLGLTALALPAQAKAPAFIRATVCDAAGPIAAGATVLRREVKAGRTEAAPSQARRRAPAAARPAPRTELPASTQETPVEPEASLRPALHYCLTPGGSRGPAQWT